MTQLCPACAHERDRWLDTRPSTHVDRGISINCSAAYDDTAAGVRWRTSDRHRRWVELVRHATGLIERWCREQRHDTGTATAAVVELPALDRYREAA